MAGGKFPLLSISEEPREEDGPSRIKHGCFTFWESLLLVLLPDTTHSICQRPSKGKAHPAQAINHTALLWSCDVPATISDCLLGTLRTPGPLC